MSATRHLYVFTAPYKTSDPEAMKRQDVHHPAHIQSFMGLLKEGTVQTGGPMLSSDSNPAGPPSEQKRVGVFVLFRAESIEQVREIVETDLFYTEDIWLKEEIRINPVLAAGPALI